MITKADSSLVVDARHSTDTWCIFEHQAVMQAGEPPVVILVGACKLVDVYRLVDGKINSAWAEIFQNGGSVLVRIVGTTLDKLEAFREASRLNRELTPRCNLAGYNLRGKARAIFCLNNQKRYSTQGEAATDLSIHPSAISRHLKGELTHAQGFKFEYAADVPLAGMGKGF